MIRYLFLLFIGKDRVFLLISRNNDLDALFKVRLSTLFLPSRTALSAASLIIFASSAPDAPEAILAIFLKFYITFKFYFLSVYFQYILSSFKIRKLYRYPSVNVRDA